MNLLREYIRELLTEAAKGLADLGGMGVYVDHADGEIEIWIIDPTIVPPETDKRRRFQMNQAAIGLMSATQDRGE